ncbi:MAG TPA: DinB family protein [Motilibacterales bacterium]|nr:DinB family protein [Motilibacterales bacterium]
MTSESPSHDARSTDLAGLIRAYREATDHFVAVASALPDTDLDRTPADPGGWTPRMVIHHVADSETNSYVRLRRLLAEPAGSTIQGYDEAQWAGALHYDRPVERSLAVFRAVRESSAELLDLIGPEDLARAGVHTESGPYTLGDWLDTYAAHARDHAEQIRAALG